MGIPVHDLQVGRTGEICGGQVHVLERWRWAADSALGKFFVTRALLAADYVFLRDNKSRALVYGIGF